MKVKKNEQINGIPSKGKIVFAWILLIILIACTGGLVYLKNFNSNDGYESEVFETESTVISDALASIVDNFNKNSLVSDYEMEGLALQATLDDMAISVSYSQNGESGIVQYKYQTIDANLMVTFDADNKEINNKIFKIMVLACRARVSLLDDVSSEIDAFLSGELTTVTGLSMEQSEDTYIYRIDIRTPLGDVTSDISTTDANSDENIDTGSATSETDTDLYQSTITSGVDDLSETNGTESGD